MAAPDIANTWDNIRRGVKDAELLIGQNKYNFSMVKSRQVLELMISYLCDNAGLEAEDLASSIDALYDGEWITKTTCEHYHKIRMLGNKAVHEGNDNGYDANQAYHLLSQEVYTFANDYKSKKGGSARPQRGGGRSPASRSQGSRSGGSRGSGGSSSRGGAPRSSGSQRSRGSSGSRNSRSRRRQPSSGFSVSPTDLIRIGLVLVVILVIFLAVRLISPKEESDDQATSSSPVQTVAPPTLPETSAPTVPVETETMAETTPTPVYKTSAGLNVRSEPSTAGQILGLLESGTIIDYVEDYDDEWVVINYNGTEAYVSSQYLVHD